MEYAADEDAVYEKEYVIDLSALRPTVAFPHLPENTRTIDNVGQVKIDQVVIGSCTNGRLSDLRIAANLLKGKKVAKNVRCIVFPGTQTIYLDAMREGLVEAFIQAGAWCPHLPAVRAWAGHMGILAAGGAGGFHDQPELCRPHGDTWTARYTWPARRVARGQRG